MSTTQQTAHFMQTLKQETKELHQKMEEVQALKQIFQPGPYSEENYKHLISRFYSFIKPSEQAIAQNTELMSLLNGNLSDYLERRRTPLLIKDLELLSLNPASLPDCSRLPPLQTLETRKLLWFFVCV